MAAAVPQDHLDHLDHLRHLADVVRNNLENQQGWANLHVYDADDLRSSSGSHGHDHGHDRTLLTGLPPRRLYIHPDEQIEILRAERALGPGRRIPQPPEYEWVLPIHLVEAPSVSQFAAVFDTISAVPPDAATASTASAESVDDDGLDEDDDGGAQWKAWRGARRGKRILLAVVQDDSTVVYYFMHDGIVKPRQN